MITSYFANQGPTWQCKREHEWFFSCPKSFNLFSKSFILGWMFFTNKPLLVLDGHGNHVTLKETKHAQEFGFDIITLPFHTSHFLQPLNISYFEPFKIK